MPKNAPPLGSHVFQANENCPAPWRPCFSPIWTIFELVRDINKTYILSKLLDWAKIVTSNWASNVTSTVLTGFELSRGINGTNVLTEFHEDQTINVASRVFTRQNVDDALRTTDKRRSQKFTICTLCSVFIGNPCWKPLQTTCWKLK
ncbi:hypothetical protein DPMN_015958 [Dreissena polymorpha]|uniref:Uncharacterized protein n=1 Tax=Dreissena polymorpha TaxID=45954 RepID=A0A9D4NDM4_DREPO|nr:hypothetical protein DPMN_015958 [Dreissena polymorpha]